VTIGEATDVSPRLVRVSLALMSSPNNRDLINRFYSALNERKFDEISGLVDPEVVQECRNLESGSRG